MALLGSEIVASLMKPALAELLKLLAGEGDAAGKIERLSALEAEAANKTAAAAAGGEHRVVCVCVCVCVCVFVCVCVCVCVY